MRFASICAMKERSDYNTPHQWDNMTMILSGPTKEAQKLGSRPRLASKCGLWIFTCQLPFFCLYCARKFAG